MLPPDRVGVWFATPNRGAGCLHRDLVVAGADAGTEAVARPARMPVLASGSCPRPTPVPGPDDDGVVVSLIRWMLSLSADERLAVLQGFADSIAAMTDEPPRPQVLRRALEESAT